MLPRKKWRFIPTKLEIFMYIGNMYIYAFFNKKKEYKNFKYRQPKAIPNVLTFNFRNVN